MVVCYPQSVQPWSRDLEEERRFRRILVTVLLIFAVMGYLVPNWVLPQLEQPWELELPPRIARIIADTARPASRPPTATAQSAAPDPAPEKAGRTEPQEPPAATPPGKVVRKDRAAGDRVARAGVLALSDRLARLRSSAPQATDAAPRSTAVAGDRGLSSRSTSRLTEDVTGGSVGIGSEPVTTRGVLGEAVLPGKSVASLQPSGTGTAAPDAATADRPGSGRSQEEIQEILDRNKRAIYALYNRELRFDPALRGKVVLGITIAPTGEVTDCRIISSELNAASLEQKLVLLIKRIDFGAKPGVPSVQANVPIEFFPA